MGVRDARWQTPSLALRSAVPVDSAGQVPSAAFQPGYRMRPCSACVHPDRVVIDAELQQRVSLRTVAGRHGLSTTAVHRHQTQHLEGAIIGDV